jgi:hypothetical protein
MHTPSEGSAVGDSEMETHACHYRTSILSMSPRSLDIEVAYRVV